MKRVLTNPARYKIFKIGLMQSAWQIDKGVLGIPDARYKNGVIYLRDTEADHPLNTPKGQRGIGVKAMKVIFVHELIHACGLENCDHNEEGFF